MRVFWFNPFLAAVRGRLTAAREEACDARALAGCGDADRRAYAQSLIAALRLAGGAEPVAAFTGFHRKGAQRRVLAILKPAARGRGRALIAAGVGALGLACALGGVSLALAAEPEAPAAPPAPVLAAAPAVTASPLAAAAAPATVQVPTAAVEPATPAASAPAAPPLPPRPHQFVMHNIQVEKDKDGKAREHHVMSFAHDGEVQTYEFDDLKDLTPEQRKQIEQAMKDAKEARQAAEKARIAGAAARESGRKAREQAQVQMLEFRRNWDAQRAQMRQSMEEARKANPNSWVKDDGKVLMRCSVKPDGSADKCERVAGPMFFRLQRGPGPGPGGLPPFPAPAPLPPAPPQG